MIGFYEQYVISLCKNANIKNVRKCLIKFLLGYTNTYNILKINYK